MSDRPLLTFDPPAHQSDLFRLPSGDWINTFAVEAARVSEKANRVTGEVGGIAYINAGGSWYSIAFDHAADAHTFLDALIEYRNKLHRPTINKNALSRQAAADLVATLKQPDGDEA